MNRSYIQNESTGWPLSQMKSCIAGSRIAFDEAMKFQLLFVYFIFQLSLSVARGAEPDCGTEKLKDNLQATYCIQKPEVASSSGQVIYYFHGLGGNAREAFNEGLTAETSSAPIIAVSFGQAWFFAPEVSQVPGSAILKAFVDELMPRLEARLSPSVEISKRALVGASMGGHNATQIYMQHGELFSRIALLCPALSEVSPYATPREILDYIRRTNADPQTVARAFVVGRIAFPTREGWESATPFNPENLNRIGPLSPPLYVSIGRQDEWGFYEGTEAFVEQLRSRNVSRVEWKPVDGKHCSFDREVLGAFLSE